MARPARTSAGQQPPGSRGSRHCHSRSWRSCSPACAGRPVVFCWKYDTLGIQVRLQRRKVVCEVARKTIIVSDLTGKEIEAKDAAKVTITYADARRGQVVLDVNAREVEELASKGVRQARRGRRPKAVS